MDSKWTQNKVINKDWENLLKPINSTTGKIYNQIKTQKKNEPLWIITSGCNTVVESSSIFVEKILYSLADKLPSKV